MCWGLKGFFWLCFGNLFGPLGIQYSNDAEILGIKMALQVFSKSTSFKNCALIIESDSTIALSWVCKPKPDLGRDGTLRMRLIGLVRRLEWLILFMYLEKLMFFLTL